ncbi:MAG: exosome complex protein Rrp4 [Nitrososphaeria archaeon]|nr:exosome complex protein Rrp4 [Aigarchaeota archaeon]MCX8187095.1 exosome complex protein Rrp4 [Nitrososphaeria archaeon]MDW8021367.1 exosome complex protein Rrp4 [Nitrososphaerota archaeon]
MPIYFSEHEVVLPGQLLSDNGKRSGEGTYSVEGKVYAARIGFATVKGDKIHVIPLKGVYKPMPGDRVIGVVSDVKPNGFEVNLGKHLTGIIRIPDKEQVQNMRLKVGDAVYVKVKSSGLGGVLLERDEQIKKFESGLLVQINPIKIPRLIGRRGSMILMVKKLTGCDIVIGKNGLIVINGPSPKNEFAAMKAIQMIEEEAHTSGLTERVEKMIREIISS